MESQFYRPGNTKRWLRSVAKSAAKNKKRTGLLLLASFLVFYLLFDNKGIIARVRLEMKKRDLIAKVAATEKENDALKAQIKELEGDKKTIEKIAREKYGMARPGEKLYRVQKEQGK